MEALLPLSPNAEIVYQFLAGQPKHRWTSELDLTRCKKIDLEPEQLHQALNDLLEGQLIWHRISQSGNHCYRVQLEEDNCIEELRRLLQTKKHLSKNYRELAYLLNCEQGAVQQAVKELEQQKKIKTISVKKIGPCIKWIPTTNEDIKEPLIQEEVDEIVEEIEEVIEEVDESLKQLPTLYLVDTENASNLSFYEGIDHLTSNDRILLIMSQNSRGFLTPTIAHHLFQTKAKVDSVLTTSSGKNSLDFVLVCEASLQFQQNRKQNLRILAKDQGYDGAIQYLKEKLNLHPYQLRRIEDFHSK